MKHCDICGKEKDSHSLDKFSINNGYKELICSQSNIHYHEKYNVFRGFLNYISNEKTFIVCTDCTDNYKRLLKRAENAFSDHDDVRLVSYKYHGHIEVQGEGLTLKTDFFRDRDEAEDYLKILAAYNDCDVVLQVKFIKETDSEETEKGGTHYFTVFAYTGIAYKSLYYHSKNNILRRHHQ